MLKAGAMDRLLEIQKPSLTVDAVGGRVEAWELVCKAWAELVPQSVRARYDGAVESSEEKLIFRMRYRDGILGTYRLLHNAKAYQITGVQEVGRREGLEITAVGVA
jgi:head-tail adaptor